ncbi:hypothetical protein C6558_22155 [Ensifer sp. NM-2]|nr:hypothetical protein [Ensifer canadensis]PSS62276.1 hypothetical protein C6558_22155 [Ensifer sp. NM-2]
MTGETCCSPHPRPCSGDPAARRLSGQQIFQPKDLGWLDSCDRHRNEGALGVNKTRECRTGHMDDFVISLARPLRRARRPVNRSALGPLCAPAAPRGCRGRAGPGLP